MGARGGSYQSGALRECSVRFAEVADGVSGGRAEMALPCVRLQSRTAMDSDRREVGPHSSTAFLGLVFVDSVFVCINRLTNKFVFI